MHTHTHTHTEIERASERARERERERESLIITTPPKYCFKKGGEFKKVPLCCVEMRDVRRGAMI